MKRLGIISILAIVVLAYAVANAAWLHRGASLYGRDVAGHLQLALKLHYRLLDILRSGAPPAARARSAAGLFHEESLPFHHTYIWPKLVHVLAAIWCLPFGPTLQAMTAVNLIFLTVLLAAVYLIGARCCCRRAGLLAAVLVSLYPAVYGQSRKFGLDFPLTAMTALSIYFLMRAAGSARFGDAALFGLSLGAGMLTKGQIVIYVAGPFAAAWGAALIRARSGRLSCLCRGALAAAVAAGISSPWWWGIARDLWKAYFATVTDYPFSWAYEYYRQPPFSLRWLLFHAVHGAISISPLCAAAFILALPGFLGSRCRGKSVLCAWIVCGYAVWTVSNIKRDSDFYPCLPAVALVTAGGIMSWKSRAPRRAVVAALVALCAAQFASVSFSPAGYAFWTPANPYGRPAEPDGYGTPFQPPFPNNYREVMDAFDAAIRSRVGDTRYLRIGFIETRGDERWVEYCPAILEYYFRLRDPGAFLYRSRYTPDAFVQHALSYAFLIVMDRRDGAEPDWGECRNFYDGGAGGAAIRRYFGSRAAFDELLSSYRGYAILARFTLFPERCGMYLCARGPVPLRAGGEIPAGAYERSDLLTTPSLVGPCVPRHRPPIPEYDMLFPHWLRFALVDRDLRFPGDPYFCEYSLDFPAGGEYLLSLLSEGGCAGGVSVYFDGRPVPPQPFPAQDGGEAPERLAWRKKCALSVAAGVRRLRIEGRGEFPLLSALRFDTVEALRESR